MCIDSSKKETAWKETQKQRGNLWGGEILDWKQQYSEWHLTQWEAALLELKPPSEGEASSLLDAMRCLHPASELPVQAAGTHTHTCDVHMWSHGVLSHWCVIQQVVVSWTDPWKARPPTPAAGDVWGGEQARPDWVCALVTAQRSREKDVHMSLCSSLSCVYHVTVSVREFWVGCCRRWFLFVYIISISYASNVVVY